MSGAVRGRAPRSIRLHLLAGTAVVLAVFVVLTALSVSYSVHRRAETALFDRLQGLVYGILGATEIDADARLLVNETGLPDRRLNQTTAGLFAEIVAADGQVLWQSRSSTAVIPDTRFSLIGNWQFERIEDARGDVHDLQFTTAWELADGDELPFIVHVVAPAAELSGQLRRFDQTLWLTLLTSAALMLLVQLIVLSRSMRPLARIGAELARIEAGTSEQIDAPMPRELAPLAHSINALLASERNRHRQYRHLIDDLAHNLKTPLSVLQNLAHPRPVAVQSSGVGQRGHPRAFDSEERALLDANVRQMRSTLTRYLQRAASRSAQHLAAPQEVAPVIARINRSLAKLYGARAPRLTLTLAPDIQVRIAEADLHEILGNIMENACKYGARHVRVHSLERPLDVCIDDDGPGFPSELRARLTERGVRADSMIEGEGLGLAASCDLLESYGGRLELGQSPEGGARVILHMP